LEDRRTGGQGDYEDDADADADEGVRAASKGLDDWGIGGQEDLGIMEMQMWVQLGEPE
jgi:hypothetical protein